MTKRCLEHSRLYDLATGRLEGTEAASAHEHLESCPKCQAEFEALTGALDHLADWSPPPLRPGFEARVMANISRAPAEKVSWAARLREFMAARPLPMAAGALAAALLVVVFTWATGNLGLREDRRRATIDDGIGRLPMAPPRVASERRPEAVTRLAREVKPVKDRDKTTAAKDLKARKPPKPRKRVKMAKVKPPVTKAVKQPEPKKGVRDIQPEAGKRRAALPRPIKVPLALPRPAQPPSLPPPPTTGAVRPMPPIKAVPSAKPKPPPTPRVVAKSKAPSPPTVDRRRKVSRQQTYRLAKKRAVGVVGVVGARGLTAKGGAPRGVSRMAKTAPPTAAARSQVGRRDMDKESRSLLARIDRLATRFGGRVRGRYQTRGGLLVTIDIPQNKHQRFTDRLKGLMRVKRPFMRPADTYLRVVVRPYPATATLKSIVEKVARENMGRIRQSRATRRGLFVVIDVPPSNRTRFFNSLNKRVKAVKAPVHAADTYLRLIVNSRKK